MRTLVVALWLGGTAVAQQSAVHLSRGADLLQRNQPGPAIQELKKAVALDPRSAAAHQLLGQAYLAQGAIEMMAEAKAELQQALDLDPTLIWARFYLAKIHLDLGRLERARLELERGLEIRPNVPHLLSLLGEVRRRLGNAAASIELNRKALEIDASMTPAHYYLALAYLDQKQNDEALRELQQAVQSKYVIPEMYLTLGSIYRDRGRLVDAAEVLRKAIALDVRRPEGHLRLAEVHRLRGAHEPALAELKLAAPEERRFLSTEYYQHLRADVWCETGRVYADQENRDRAVEAYRRALEMDPNHEGAQRELGRLGAMLR